MPLVLVAAVLAATGAGSAEAGPADASCVYLALGCTAPTIQSIFDEIPPNVPARVAPDAAVGGSGDHRLRRHASASRHRHAVVAKRRHKHVEPNPAESSAS